MWERHEFLTDVPTGRFAAPTVWRNTFRHGPERPKPIEMTALPLLLCIISGWRSIVYSIKGKHLVSVLLFFLSCKTLVSFNDPMKKSKCIAWSICPLKLLKNKGWRLHLMDWVWSHDVTKNSKALQPFQQRTKSEDVPGHLIGYLGPWEKLTCTHCADIYFSRTGSRRFAVQLQSTRFHLALIKLCTLAATSEQRLQEEFRGHKNFCSN